MSNEQRPLFSVGERVKLVSVNYPECSGEYIIKEIKPKNLYSDFNFHYGYILSDMTSNPWGEPALRKIYDSGEYSFDELMNVLKSPITENV